MDAAIVVREWEREIMRKKSSDKNMKNRLGRMVRDDEGCSENKIPRNRACCQKFTIDDTVYTR